MNSANEFSQTLRQWHQLAIGHSMRNVLRQSKLTGLSMVQWAALIRISRQGPATVSHIGEILGISPAAASQLLERLVQQGLVSRVENPDDRRTKHVELTPAGRQVLTVAMQTRQQWLEALEATLSPEEQAQVTEALHILIDKTRTLELDP